MMKASEQVYHTPELLLAILELLDGTSLARMLRVERAVTASAAAVLYREVSRTVIGKMSRATPRRAAYCDAVRSLDWSNWRPDLRFNAFCGTITTKPVRFSPKTFLPKIQAWKRKYPRLQTIRYQYPDGDNDDRYVVHLGGDKIIVELEIRVDRVIHNGQLVPARNVSFRRAGSHPLIQFRHTYITLFASWCSPLPIAWSTWIYANPNMNRRITGIDLRTPLGRRNPSLSIDDALSFVAFRNAQGCLPLTQFDIIDEYDCDQLRTLATALGPAIRTLYLHRSDILTCEGLQTMIDILDAAFPKLQSLHVEQQLDTGLSEPSFRFSGLPALRQLVVNIPGQGGSRLARYVSGLGGKDCVYICGGVYNSIDLGIFHRAVKSHRKNPGTVPPSDDSE